MRAVLVCQKCKCAVFCSEEHAKNYRHDMNCDKLAESSAGTRGLYTMKWPKLLMEETKSLS